MEVGIQRYDAIQVLTINAVMTNSFIRTFIPFLHQRASAVFKDGSFMSGAEPFVIIEHGGDCRAGKIILTFITITFLIKTYHRKRPLCSGFRSSYDVTPELEHKVVLTIGPLSKVSLGIFLFSYAVGAVIEEESEFF